MKLTLTMGLSVVFGLMLSLLPVQFYLPASESILNKWGQVIPNPHVTWLNFYSHEDFYESLVTVFAPGLLLTFAPTLLALQWRFLRLSKGWAVLLSVEALVLIG